MKGNMMKLARKRNLIAAAAVLGLAAGVSSLNAGTCSINGNTVWQTIDGVGFATAWSGTLTTAKNNALYNTLGFSLMRVRFDENNAWTEAIANSSAAHARGAKVLGCPWAIPASMRTSTSVPYTLKDASFWAYTDWLRQAAASINCDYVSLKNEPDMYNSVDGNLTPTAIMVLCRYYAANIGKTITIADAVGFSDSYTDPALNDAEAVGKFSIVSGHLYGNGNYIHWNAWGKGKKIWQTEHYQANSRDSINNAVLQAYEIQQCFDNLMSAYFYWWVADFDASVNLVNQSGTIYKAGYVAGQFAKWVRPGKVRIGCTTYPTSNVAVNAFRSGGLVITAVNKGSSSVSQTFAIANVAGVSTLNVNRTSGSENMAYLGTVNASSGSFTYTLPAYSVTTFHQY
jgi:glucuronoarabinoxylan endo-1,4-beta-xylanase